MSQVAEKKHPWLLFIYSLGVGSGNIRKQLLSDIDINIAKF